MLDLGLRDADGFIASFLLPGQDGEWTVVETGPTPSLPRLERGIAEAGIDPRRVSRVLVTHIHLDHAGGAGSVLSRFPKARLYVHSAGVAHLLDPSRLLASARRAWGSASDALWGTVESVAPSRIVALSGGEHLPLAEGAIDAIATPGHASHHLSFFDSATHALMTGDSAGVRLEGAWRPRPAIPPPELDLELLFYSLERMAELAPRELWYTHFGPAPNARQQFQEYRRAVTEWRDAGLETAVHNPSIESIAHALETAENRAAVRAGIPNRGTDNRDILSAYTMAAQGLLRYFRKKGLVSG